MLGVREPLQFDDKDDLANYPRQLEQDAELLGQAGCRALFAPAADDRTPASSRAGMTWADWMRSSRRQQAGHFQGVVNVVERLFHAVRPDLACFGERTASNWPCCSMGPPPALAGGTGALPDRARAGRPGHEQPQPATGAQDRERATALYRSLAAAAELAFRASVSETEKAARAVLESTPGVEPDYFAIADPRSLRPLSDWNGWMRPWPWWRPRWGPCGS